MYSILTDVAKFKVNLSPRMWKMGDFEGSVFVGIVFLKLPICWDFDTQSSLEFLEKGSNKRGEQQRQLDGSEEHGQSGSQVDQIQTLLK